MSAVELRLRGHVHHAVGLMSGTSHDGINAALVRFDDRRSPPTKLIAFRTSPYTPTFRQRMLDAASGVNVGAPELSALNFELGRLLGRAALGVMREVKFDPHRLGFIGSHGHTFFHLPPRTARRGQTASTMQLGEPSVIAAITGAPVVADFRPMDIALGGEGAPLAPLAHLWLFGDRRRGRVVQNIGGIGNATYLPPTAHTNDPRVIAFDTGPGGMMIDALAARLSGGKLTMDRDGAIAARGRVYEPFLAELMRDRYFRRRPPKSTGREEYGASRVEAIVERATVLGVKGDDLIATITALTARSIADACRRFIIPLGPVDQLVATGGGARNPTLLAMLAAELPGVEVLTASDLGIDGDALEAIAFSILAWQMLNGRPGNIPSVTGARHPAILGKLVLPP